MKRILTVVTVLALLGWCLLVLLSWLLSAMMVSGVRSLLTGEGVRWLLSHLADGLSSPLLAWLLLAAMTGGCLVRSRLFDGSLKQSHTSRHNSSRNAALRTAVLLLLAFCTVIALLTAPHQAVLLSATGSLWHSPFSRALVPLSCTAAIIAAVAYGLVAHTFASLQDIIASLLDGLRFSAPLIYAYMLLMPLAKALLYVFS